MGEATEEYFIFRLRKNYMEINIPQGKVRVSVEQGLALAEVLNSTPLPFNVEYLQYKLKWEKSFGLLAMREYYKFLILAKISKVEITPSEAIDEVWHLHILHTKNYAEFNDKCGGFLHHFPGLPTQKVRWNRQYELTLELYREVFLEEPPQSVWPGQPKKETRAPIMIADVLKLYLQSHEQMAA